MLRAEGREGENKEASSGKNQISAPSISLPKGGGAIRGIGEKFAANPVTGTGSMTVPIATSPGRSGFGPQLSLSYDSGSGNGPFGLGWNLSLPSITRKTDKGLPQYRDTEESDVFILSGAEDLVPVLEAGKPFKDDTTVSGYTIYRYRPRIEGLFARIERWINSSDPNNTFWRSISKDNITTWYGKSENNRIADPADKSRIFTWLICESYDDKGNAISYEYAEENSANVNLSQVNEKNRTIESRQANRYLKRIKYGNLPSRLIEPDFKKISWLFEVVFDYGEGHYQELPADSTGHQFIKAENILTDEDKKRPARSDPFSSYRAGFEVRTYRLCRRILMFHHFAELNTADYLVRSTEFDYNETPIASFIKSVTQSGYLRQKDGTYLKKSLPPLEFEYSEATINEDVMEIDPESIENLPVGLDGAQYQWVDLDGEGLSGILTEQADAWFYKPNIGDGRFGPMEKVTAKPSLAALSSGRQQLLDLAGDGQLDLVDLEGPVTGFYERTHDKGWENFTPFTSLPNISYKDPNLRFIDLTGDGHADIMITEDEAFTWYPSLAEEGFAPAERVRQALDEEAGPRLVFADGTQTIYLADMSGDGLTDIARIRNGEVCYWPNQGYGRFGAKVTMDNAPWFDYPDLFDLKRIRLADIDGSGVTDIIYLGSDAVHLYFNQSGNSWSKARKLTHFPRIDNLSSVQVADLLGNGTACLVWSSPLTGDVRSPMRYIKLMEEKPHLLTKTVNNLGAETHIQYTSSTKFYLEDRLSGKPWITKLPFPVHVVEKVTAIDQWRNTRFTSTYSYHHGYFDSIEREFRGFGRVEQVDVESFGEFKEGNIASPYITQDHTLYQPPIKTITWFHTGAAIDRQRILTQFQTEYFPNSLAALPGYSAVLKGFDEKPLPEPDLETQDLSAYEWLEALRACKGMTLRQEIYELDVDQLEGKDSKQIPVRLFSTATHNGHIRCLQPKGKNQHAVFHVTESEALSYHYELDLRPVMFPSDPKNVKPLQPDPRIAHTLNLKIDEYGNILESVAAAYPRIGSNTDSSLSSEHRILINHIQKDEHHLALNCTRFTEDIDEADSYRLRMPCQTQTWEVTGIQPIGKYFTLSELKGKNLSSIGVSEISYHIVPVVSDDTPQKRLVECARTLFFADDLKTHRPFGQHGPLGLSYETYKLALTTNLLSNVYVDPVSIATALSELDKQVNNYPVSGYYKGDQLFAGNPITPELLENQYWLASGRAGFENDAAKHFYLPERYTDPFGNVTTLAYDINYDLYIQSSKDALGNITQVKKFDYRVLAPAEMEDINGNHTEVCFDALGLVVAVAVKGKQQVTGTWEGDHLDDFNDALLHPPHADVAAFCTGYVQDNVQARAWLAGATTRFVYHFGETLDTKGNHVWCRRMAGACVIAREQHAGQLEAGVESPIHVSLECSDGMGNVLMKKVQAEPEPVTNKARWVINGLTVLNNKGKPVKQYEPDFSDRFGCELPQANGVTQVMYYDAAGRVVRTEMPDGSFSRVEFSPWFNRSYDANDTILEPGNRWYAEHTAATASAEDKRAASLAAEHANTPSETHLDSLGRDVITIAHNRVKDTAGNWQDEKYFTYTKLDAEGKPLWIRDARGNLVMQYIQPPMPNNQASDATTGFAPCYDIAGNLLFQHSMDAGDRWMINDAAGKPMLAWNLNDKGTGSAMQQRTYRTEYDALHRPVGSFVVGADPLNPNHEIQYEKIIYGEGQSPNGKADKALNLRGKPYIHYDTAGVVTNEAYDFKGNLLCSTRQLIRDYKSTPDWTQSPKLETETFSSRTAYDALNRPIQLIPPHSNREGTTIPIAFNVIQPIYNEASLLEGVDVWLERPDEPGALKNSTTEKPSPVGVYNIDYDAKGQRQRIDYKNGATTFYSYDTETFRLIHLYTKRGATFTEDCENPTPPPDTIAAPEIPPSGKYCGLQNLHYTYDPVGNITHIRDDAQQTIYFKNQRVEPSNDYTYDALYRLIEATGREHLGLIGSPPQPHSYNDISRINLSHPSDGKAMGTYTEQYVYDAVGNFLSMRHVGNDTAHSGWKRCYQYANDSNRLLSTGNFNDPLIPCKTNYDSIAVYQEKYGYDVHGNMLKMPQLQIMQWDFKDQLQMTQRQKVNPTDADGTHHQGERTYYVYDAGGQRVRKVTERQAAAGQTPTRKNERIYLGGFEIYRDYDPSTGSGQSPSLERETLHIMDDKQRIALVETKTQGSDDSPPQLIRYQFGNHLGSASLELDDKAQIISYEEYTPYGSTSYQAVDQSIKAAAKRYRYTGKERDEETGFTYHGARYYVPWLGRWTSCDPAGLVGSSNPYAYVSGSPIVKYDDNGLWEVNMHFGAVYWSGLLAGADHQTALRVALSSQSLDDFPQTSAPEMKGVPPVPGTGAFGRIIGTSPSITDFIINRANNAHALHVTREQSRQVADFGIRTKNEVTFGIGLHAVGDYLSHANLSGTDTPGHQIGYNEDMSESHFYMHDADYTYKNPQKAYATFESFRGLWEQFLGKTPKTDVKDVVRAQRQLSKDQFEAIAKFINSDQTNKNEIMSSLREGLKTAGVSNKYQIALIEQLMRNKDLRRQQFEGLKATERGGKGYANAWCLFDWIADGKNSAMNNSMKIDIAEDLKGLPNVGDATFEQRKQTNINKMREAQLKVDWHQYQYQ